MSQKTPRPGDLSPTRNEPSSGNRQYDRDGEEDGHHADTARPARGGSSAGPGSIRSKAPATPGGPNTQSNDRGDKSQDNEGQQGGQKGGAKGR